MAKVGKWSALGVRISLTSLGGRSADQVFVWLRSHFADPNQVLPKAVNCATERAWKAFSMALEDRQGFTQHLQRLFSSGAVKGMEDMLRKLITEQDEAFKAGCRAEWSQLDMVPATDADWLQEVASIIPVTHSTDLLAQARAVIKQEADTLRQAGLVYLPQLMEIELPQAGGPLLLHIFNSFLRAEAMVSAELSQMLSFTLLEAQSAKQDLVLEMLEEIRNRLPAEMVREPIMQPGMTAILRSADDQRMFEAFLQRVQALPEAMDNAEIHAALGRLGMALGQFEKAQALFAQSAATTTEHEKQAQAHYNAHRAALEQKHWKDAKQALLTAAKLDPASFEPFPLHRYTVQRILGAGGFGTAFLCHDPYLDIPVVIKTLHPTALDKEVREVFREARVLQTLHHPNIIQMMHCDFADPAQTRPYLVMAYFPGMALGDYLHQHGCLDVASVRQLALLLAQAMHAAHTQEILHRDIKPANILVHLSDTGIWNACIIDFGLALHAEQVQKTMRASRFTGSLFAESVGGSYQYAAPEQMGLRSGKVGPHSDVFGFGKTLCQALFATTNPTRRDWRTLEADDEVLADTLSQCIEEDITRRMPSFATVLEALRKHEQEEVKRKQQEEEAKRKQQEDEAKRKQQEEEAKRKQQEEAKQTSETAKPKKIDHYLDPGDGTVIDTQTGLQWMRCSLGQTWEGGRCVGGAKKYKWNQALEAAKDLNQSGGYAGYTDWRLPSIKELHTLVYCSSGEQNPLEFKKNGKLKRWTGGCEGDYQQPTINLSAFPDTPRAWFQSASPYAGRSYRAWDVAFYGGYVNYYGRNDGYAVRLVRGGQ